MAEEFSIEQYLYNGINNILRREAKAFFSNPRESVYIAKYARAAKRASKKRGEAEKQGNSIPAFLIASITSACNLHCAGCYARAMDACNDSAPSGQMTGEEWGKVFKESKDLGISFILLAGGEPLIRRDVMQEAAKVPQILFPVFTNGTLLKGDTLDLFDRNRNLVPVISMEGSRKSTDTRRGEGMFSLLDKIMACLKDRGILFGASITVTTKNLAEVLSDEFVDDLASKGCSVVIYVEYVPAEKGTEDLAPQDADRAVMEERLLALRQRMEGMVFLSFPGDEAATSGCLAAGRGFFHINSHGGAEPCPFSPVSDVNVRDTGVAGALKSGLFQALRDSGMQEENHSGGCALFGKDERILELLQPRDQDGK
ncbi:MAG: radical SAM protein [Clostridia bacterium]|nr:radical SAM protein [Clostridia bacterium]